MADSPNRRAPESAKPHRHRQPRGHPLADAAGGGANRLFQVTGILKGEAATAAFGIATPVIAAGAAILPTGAAGASARILRSAREEGGKTAPPPPPRAGKRDERVSGGGPEGDAKAPKPAATAVGIPGRALQWHRSPSAFRQHRHRYATDLPDGSLLGPVRPRSESHARMSWHACAVAGHRSARFEPVTNYVGFGLFLRGVWCHQRRAGSEGEAL
jgi:hypothetical protein